MKKRNFILVTLAIFAAVLFNQCKDDEENEPKPNNQEDILPSSFKVDIPGAISNTNPSSKRTNDDNITGDDIYGPLTWFIHVGESAAEIVEDIMLAIAVHNLNQPMTFSFVSDDDDRTKNVEVIEDSQFDGETWMYQLTITDAGSEGNDDGGKAMQVFWNNDPVKGIAILKPYNIDRDENQDAPNAMYRIDYSEVGENGYEQHMIVSIDELPMEDPSVDPYSINSLKMFAGKTGNIVDVYGNSNHPNAQFFNNDIGFNWAFVASGHEQTDLGVAEVGLPPSTLDETGRDVLLGDYSIKNVFENQIYEMWPDIDSAAVAKYLVNTEAPGYFDTYGFIQGGTAPGQGYTELEANILQLSPYNPNEIQNLAISFK